MLLNTTSPLRSRLRASRRRWRSWRRTRPFWGGLLATTGGAAILLLPADLYTVLSLPGTAGLAGFLLGGIITTTGLLLWYQPRHHTLLSLITTLAALASFLYTNFGGFLIGMLLALTGGSLAFAWTPTTEPPTTEPPTTEPPTTGPPTAEPHATEPHAEEHQLAAEQTPLIPRTPGPGGGARRGQAPGTIRRLS
ncbi:DUF6114 domain-containing protein [Actinomadura bangladeshensis]|uniref:Integral membrane protein n=1 Tax=Actinomadura bangladeshensis TaxID=453573 RepID=A0A6L9QA86_9ACTN|nr:DUF6114 domain-containing protein [Actinomadura bangladeshensis]NEA21962.1 hypothetical protein [Actinomadura bangladeshensis]